MSRVFDLLMMLYPAAFREEFGDEMRSVFLAIAAERKAAWFVWTEFVHLIRGALYEQFARSRQTLASSAIGAVFACGAHILMYWLLVPIAYGQQPVRQDAAVLELAKSIYRNNLTALRDAKTLDDLRKLAAEMDSPDWISVDRFGRTGLTRTDADRELASVLAVAPERRMVGIEIVWAGRDSDHLTVVAWIMPNEVERVDSEGEYGAKGTTHRLTRGTLVRDIFLNTGDGWRRIRHDKIVPNDLVLAVDGAPRIVPPLDERNRVRP